MPTPIDPKRLPGLKKALSELSDGERWAQKQLAELYGVANSRFTTLIKERFPDFPPHERHADKTHWYEAKPAIESMIRYMDDQARGKQAQARRHSAVMANVDAAKEEPTEPEPLTAAEIDRLASAQTRLFKLARDKGLYTLTSEVVRIARSVNTIVSRSVMNIPIELDPNGEMTPLQRQRIHTLCRQIVAKMHDELGQFLEEANDVERPGGIAFGRSGAAQPGRRRRAGGREGAVGTAA